MRISVTVEDNGKVLSTGTFYIPKTGKVSKHLGASLLYHTSTKTLLGAADGTLVSLDHDGHIVKGGPGIPDYWNSVASMVKGFAAISGR